MQLGVVNNNLVESAKAPTQVSRRMARRPFKLWNPIEGKLGVMESIGQKVDEVHVEKTKF